MPDTTQNPNQTSNPSDSGNVSATDSNDTTVSQTSSSTAPPPDQSSQTSQTSQTSQAPTPNNSAPSQQPQATGQPQDQQGPSANKQPNLAKSPQQMQNEAAQAAKTQATQKASVFHDIAETLAGGPRYKYSVAADGTMQQTKVPVSNAHLALAIAMEALSGAATGYANGQGPNGAANALAASTTQGEQRVQQQDATQRQQAQQEFARKAQVTETNMRLYANARAVGRQDEEATDKYIQQYAPIAEKLQDQLPGYVHEVVGYQGLAKYNATEQTAIPYKRVPRLGSDGKQVDDKFGNPQWDIDYLVVDPKFKTSGLITPEFQQNLKEMGYDWADNDSLNTSPLNANLALNLMSKASTWGVAKTALNNFAQVVNTAKGPSGGTTTTTADVTKDGTLKAPPIKSSAVAGLVDASANDFYKANKALQGVISASNFKALLHGMVHQESKENPDAVSNKGAAGIMQLMPATAASLGVKDPNSMEQNIGAGVKYFGQLLTKYKDPKLALAAYNAGPTRVDNNNGAIPNIPETQDYVKRITGAVGLESTKPNEAGTLNIDLPGRVKTNPSTPGDVEKFMGALNGTDGNYGKALDHLRTTGQEAAANNVASLLGGPDNVKLHDDTITAEAEARKAGIQTDALEKRAQNKQAIDQENSVKMANLIRGPENFEFDDSLANKGEKDLETSLKAKGVTIPLNFPDLYAIAKYQDDPNNYAPRVWAKGSPDEMDKQGAMSFIHKFINPDFNQKTYGALSTTARQLYNPDSRINRNIQAIGTVTNHMELLRQAAKEVASGQPVNGQFPALNRLAGEFKTQIGQPDYLTLQALARRVNNEISNVAGGGFAPHADDVEQTMKNMTAANSEQQVDHLIKTYTGIMQGRLEPVNNQIKQLTGEDIKTISPETTALFQRYGYDTPWAQKQGNNNQNQNQNQKQQVPGQRPNETPVYVNGHVVGFTMPGKSGMRPVQQQQ